MMTGPYNYVVASFRDRKTAEALVRAINRYGMWDAIVDSDRTSDPPYSHAVVLPGQCIEGTEAYMRGFLEGFMAIYEPAKVDS